jgi:L-ascorbate metabolism protein UlaG (beta-lactamase superfamily)
MKLTWHGHSAFRIEAGAAKILIDPFLSDNPSWHKGSIGSRAGEDSTRKTPPASVSARGSQGTPSTSDSFTFDEIAASFQPPPA